MSIIVENLCKSYGNGNVLNHFSGIFEEKKITCIMGKSGVGKTTLLSIMMKLEKPDSGKIIGLEGKKTGAVFQENRLFENMSAFSNVRVVSGADETEIRAVFKELDLPECDKRPVKEYSGGMKRRVAIARALLCDFDVLFMDEPFQGLDEETKQRTAETVRERTKGKTVIFITHDETECALFDAEIVEL